MILLETQAAAGNTRSGRPSTSSIVSSSETFQFIVVSSATEISEFRIQTCFGFRCDWMKFCCSQICHTNAPLQPPPQTQCMQFGVEERPAPQSLLARRGREKLLEPKRQQDLNRGVHFAEADTPCKLESK